MSSPLVSVVVPHYDDLEALDDCLVALGSQDLDPTAFEVVVADNDSPVGRSAVEAVVGDRARVVTVTERGAGPARNGGVGAARGQVLAFTDCDCRPAPGWLSAGLAALKHHDVVGGRMVVQAAPGRRTGAQSFELVFAFDNRRYVERKGFTVTANLFCGRDVFAAVGDFAVATAEDMEWCRRATAAGYRLGYADAAVVAHPPRDDWAALRAKWRRLDAERFALEARGATGRLGWLLRAWLLPASIVAHLPRLLRHPEVRGWRDRGRAALTLVRVRMWRFGDAHRLLLLRTH